MKTMSKNDYKVVDRTWGYEIWPVNNELYCFKQILCLKDKWSSNGRWHKHPKKDETFYIVQGTLLIEIDGEENRFILTSGDSIRLPPGTGHRFTSETSFCYFIEVSTTHREDDTIRYD
ncbi:MAG: cupin domain-containing protein [Candidatus Hodarchaeales archaeon]